VTDARDAELSVCELFRGIQGETSRAGLPCTFVRAAGCNLRCRYCDTAYAWEEGAGERTTVADLVERVMALPGRLVCITGGEPLRQPRGVCALAGELLTRGHTVLVETNGTRDIGVLPEGAVRVMDVKCPGSGHAGSLRAENLPLLTPCDEVKFVVTDRKDFDWAAAFVRQHWTGTPAAERPELLFSPVTPGLSAARLAAWLLESGLHARLQLQLHKIIWPGRDRGV